jgi:hypothetical protein
MGRMACFPRRGAALRKIAIAWCEEHGVAFQA